MSTERTDSFVRTFPLDELHMRRTVNLDRDGNTGHPVVTVAQGHQGEIFALVGDPRDCIDLVEGVQTEIPTAEGLVTLKMEQGLLTLIAPGGQVWSLRVAKDGHWARVHRRTFRFSRNACANGWKPFC